MSQAKIIAETLGISEITAHILIKRGYFDIDNAAKFFNLAPQDKINPMDIHGVKEAVERILAAIDSKEKIIIYGDYDVDGVTGGSLFQEYLSRHTDNVSYYIPDRVQDGYGLNKNSLRDLVKKGAQLIITVDNGIGCHEEAELAKQLGVDLIITDHHEIQPIIPDCIVVNPKIGMQLPEMAGVGVAFMVCVAIEKYRKTTGMNDLLDLVAVGTIADVAPLIGVNRQLVRTGLDIASNKKRIGLATLIEENDIFIGGKHKFTAKDVGFKIGPCLNAAGRIDRADTGVKLLTTKDPQEARELSIKLMDLNATRKDYTSEIVDRVKSHIKEQNVDTTKTIVYHSNEAFHGVAGIVAARIAEEYGVPALILGEKDGLYSGSCRAPGGYNLFEAITEMKDVGLAAGGGGHAAAAGVSVPIDLIDKFTPAIHESLSKKYDPKKKSYVKIDAEVLLATLTPDFMFELEAFQPTGAGNPDVVLLTQDVMIMEMKEFKTKSGFSMTVTDNRLKFRCMAFGMYKEMSNLKLGQKIDIAYTPEWNMWPPGSPASVQLRIRKIYY